MVAKISSGEPTTEEAPSREVSWVVKSRPSKETVAVGAKVNAFDNGEVEGDEGGRRFWHSEIEVLEERIVVGVLNLVVAAEVAELA